MENRAETVSLSVATFADTVLSLECVRLYTLQPIIAIEADNWEVGDEVFTEKDSPNDNVETPAEGGCSDTVSGAVLPILMAASAMFVWKKREARDE